MAQTRKAAGEVEFFRAGSPGELWASLCGVQEQRVEGKGGGVG